MKSILGYLCAQGCLKTRLVSRKIHQLTNQVILVNLPKFRDLGVPELKLKWSAIPSLMSTIECKLAPFEVEGDLPTNKLFRELRQEFEALRIGMTCSRLIKTVLINLLEPT